MHKLLLGSILHCLTRLTWRNSDTECLLRDRISQEFVYESLTIEIESLRANRMFEGENAPSVVATSSPEIDRRRLNETLRTLKMKLVPFPQHAPVLYLYLSVCVCVSVLISVSSGSDRRSVFFPVRSNECDLWQFRGTQ